MIRSDFIVFIPPPELALGYNGLEILTILFFLIIFISYTSLKHMFKFYLIKTLNIRVDQRAVFSCYCSVQNQNK